MMQVKSNRRFTPKLTAGATMVVLKPFDECRTPCPPKGTEGKYLGMSDDNYLRVQFRLPFTCTSGYEWMPEDPDHKYSDVDSECNNMVLLFTPDEVTAARS